MVRTRIRAGGLAVVVAVLGLLVLPAAAASAGPVPHGPPGYVCSGGEIPAGVYRSLDVTGVCFASVGNVVVLGDLNVAPGALLDDVTPGDPVSSPVLPATITVGGNVFVGRGADLLLGCSPNITCTNPPSVAYGSIRGSVVAFGAQGVVLHSVAVGGNVLVLGGGGGSAAESCNAQTPGSSTIANLEPWSEDPSLLFTPVYTDFEDSTIGGSLTVTGLTTCWLGTFRTQIGGSATFVGNNMGDPDATEITSNLVEGNMVCSANVPAVQFGDGTGAPNVVGGFAFGQCGFGVTPENPAPEAGVGTGIPEHITVRARSLQTRTGTFSSTVENQLSFGTTSSGDTLYGLLEDFTLSGSGLTGTGTYDPTQPPGQTGAAFLFTQFPDGSSRFTGFLNCSCSYGGQTGPITIRVYGTSTAHGFTSGTFLLSSGGSLSPGSLSTIAGWGTFSSAGEPQGSVRLIEHIAIT